MKESVIYQDILAQGRQKGKLEGKREGRQEGKQEEGVNLILRLLNRRFGGVLPQLSLKIQSLSVEQLENLGEALLDFESTADLEQWLENYSNLLTVV